MIKGLVFDVDGTLVDSNGYHTRCWQKAFAEAGVRVEADLIRKLIGKGAWQIVNEVLGEKTSKEEKLRVIEAHTRNFEQMIKKVQPFPGLKELFQEIKSRSLLIALATSTKNQFVEHYLDRFNLKDYVQAYTTVEEVTCHKPHPEVFFKAAEKIGLNSGEVIAVGDSIWDIQAARRGNIKVVALLTGGIKREELLRENPDWLFRNLIEFKENLDLVLESKA